MDIIQSAVTTITPPAEVDIHSTGLNVNSTYINYSQHYIAVCFRDGCYSILSPSTVPPFEDILLVTHSKSNYKDGINAVAGVEDTNLNQIKINLLRNNNRFVDWKENIDLTHVLNSRKGVYVSNLDIYLCDANRLTEDNFHPYCFQHDINKDLNPKNEFDPLNEISLHLKIVDNAKPGVDYYSILNDGIIHLRSVSSMIKKNGFYVTGSPTLHTSTSNSIRTTEITSLENALNGKARFKLFKTISEAQKFLNENISISNANEIELAAHKERIVKMKIEVETLQHQNDLLASKRTQDELELKRISAEYERLEQENKRAYELRIQELKEQAAINTHALKSDTEWMKFAAGALGFGLVLLKALA